jgi:hypothetical protein
MIWNELKSSFKRSSRDRDVKNLGVCGCAPVVRPAGSDRESKVLRLAQSAPCREYNCTPQRGRTEKEESVKQTE